MECRKFKRFFSHVVLYLHSESELNKTYGSEEVKGIKILESLREEAKKETIKKLAYKEI